MATSQNHRPHIVVVGLMGVGKSTTASALAIELGRRFVDSDVDIARLTGTSGAEFAAQFGVPALHRLEAAVLLGALAREAPSVIAAAASTIEDPLIRHVLPERAFVVNLTLPLDDAIRRQATGAHRRPMSLAELEAVAAKRDPMFATIEDLRLDASRPTDELVAAVLVALDVRPE